MPGISQVRRSQLRRAETPQPQFKSFVDFVSGLYADSSWLTVTGFLMLADTAFSLLGLALDPTIITGAPTWMKPLKFALSVLLFAPTVGWMIGRLKKTRRLASILGRAIAVALVAEIVLIDMQAARHTSSHFNTATSFDAGVFTAMGIFIGVLYTCTIILFICSCIERFADRSQGWAIRLGLLIALAGMGTGVLMSLPTPQQLAEARGTGALPRAGGHTVGGADGGPSMPVTGWSVDHGDLRIAHFVGLHAMQALLLAWWLTRNREGWLERRRVLLISMVATGFTAAFAIVLWQALRGQPFLKPDASTWSAWAACLVAVGIGTILLRNTHSTGTNTPMEKHS